MARRCSGWACFWGVERKFWQTPGVWLTMVGYAGGYTPNPTYKETCTQLTGHNEVVRVIYDPSVVSYEGTAEGLLGGHDPTQGMRQGNDVGSTYRSGIYTYSPEQMEAAKASKEVYAAALRACGDGGDHDRDPARAHVLLCRGLSPAVPGEEPRRVLRTWGGTGVTCPIGTGVRAWTVRSPLRFRGAPRLSASPGRRKGQGKGVPPMPTYSALTTLPGEEAPSRLPQRWSGWTPNHGRWRLRDRGWLGPVGGRRLFPGAAGPGDAGGAGDGLRGEAFCAVGMPEVDWVAHVRRELSPVDAGRFFVFRLA